MACDFLVLKGWPLYGKYRDIRYGDWWKDNTGENAPVTEREADGGAEMRIPIKGVKAFANTYELSVCIVYGWDGERQHIATWGRTIEKCGQATDWGNRMKDLLGWPESTHRQPKYP